MTVTTIVERLGGSELLGIEICSDLELARAVGRGFPASAVDVLIERGDITAAELHAVVIDRRTLARRKRDGQPLSSAQSDRLARLARVASFADHTFGNRDKARRWLRKPNRGLRGHVPLELLGLEVGGVVVEQALHRLAHGILA